jgi:hypothetical protein
MRIDDLKIGLNDLLRHLLLVPRLYVCVLGVHPGDSGDAACLLPDCLRLTGRD